MRRYGGHSAFRRDHTEFDGTILFALLVIFAAGCSGEDATYAPPAATGPTAEGLVVNLAVIDEAFAALETRSHGVVQELTIEQKSASYTSTMHLRADGQAGGQAHGYELVSAHEDGDRPDSRLTLMLGGQQEVGPRLEELPSLLVEEDPSYLSEADAFELTERGDTLISGIPVTVTELRRIGDSNRGRPFEHIRLYADEAGDVIRLDVVTHENTFFYEHRTRRLVELQRSGEGWLPRAVQINSNSKSFLASPVTSNIRWEFSLNTDGGLTSAAATREVADHP